MHRLATRPGETAPLSSSGFGTLVLSPAGAPDIRIPAAASRAGAIGVLDLTFCPQGDRMASLHDLQAAARGPVGVLVDADDPGLPDLLQAAPGIVMLSARGAGAPGLEAGVAAARAAGARVLVVATRVEHALLAERAGADAVVAKGDEAGGWVGEEGAFVLLQRLLDSVALPVWVHGGVGLHTVAACRVGGAAGVVLDAQVLLTRESPLPGRVRDAIGRMDGSETQVLGADLAGDLPAEAGRLRVYRRPGLAPVETCAALSVTLGHDPAAAGSDTAVWRDTVTPLVGWPDPSEQLLAIGQDAAFAADLARRFSTVGGVVQGLLAAADEAVRQVQQANPLAPGAPLAAAHGTRYPIVQGPMTRVSDRAAFAAAVADGGGAAVPRPRAAARPRGASACSARPASCSATGPGASASSASSPPELRAEQLAVVRAIAPPFALIAGGRPDQARDARGGRDRDLPARAVARPAAPVPRGRAPAASSSRAASAAATSARARASCCGSRMVATLLEELPRGADPADYHVLFAGGIHDALSAAMVAAVAAPLAARGA